MLHLLRDRETALTALVVAILLLSAVATVQAQGGWGKIDTVTSGNFDDRNPQLDRGGLGMLRWSVPFEWLIFERWTAAQGSICAMKVKNSSAVPSQVEFDSTVVISQPVNYLQEYPDICTGFSNDTVTVAAWQENDSRSAKDVLTWNVYYSYTSGNETHWSTPQMLTGAGDYFIIQNVIVRPLSDSSFILIWRSNGVLMYSTFWNGQMASPDTLVVTNYDSTEFDCESVTHSEPTVAWTGKDSTGGTVCFVAQVTSLHPVVLSSTDTIRSSGNISDPRFMTFGGQAMTFNVENKGRYTTVFIIGNDGYQQDLAADSLSDNLDGVAITFPAPINSTIKDKKAEISSLPYGWYAWERRSGSDTSLVFSGPFYGSTDTVRSAGYNRNPSMSTYLLTESYYEVFLCVWESSRTGRSHIYARVGSAGGDAVNDPPEPVRNFVLRQNYPNPFNPTTAISYRLSAVSKVSLKVYDVLGREVGTLVYKVEQPGSYMVKFDASGLPSGVYFYRLRFGSFSETKKMLLLR